MKHSKLPFEIVADKESIEITECFLKSKPKNFVTIGNESQIFILLPNAIGEALANAEFIVTACNEYDTLKAKVDIYEKALEKIMKHAYKGIVMQTAIDAQLTAKEIK